MSITTVRDQKWACDRCAASGQGKNAMAMAAQHHKKHQHPTWSEQTMRVEYGGGAVMKENEQRKIDMSQITAEKLEAMGEAYVAAHDKKLLEGDRDGAHYAGLAAVAVHLGQPTSAEAAIFNRGAREGWMRCGVFHVDMNFEGRPEEQAELDRRWPLGAGAGTIIDQDNRAAAEIVGEASRP